MNLLENIKKVLIVLVVIIVGSNAASIKAEESIASGIYSVKNSVYHESEVGMSMARGYVDEDMSVKITKGETIFTIGFSGTKYMSNFRIKINGEEVPVEIVEENANEGTIKLQASAISKDDKISTSIYVEPMGRDVEFDVIPDYSTLTLIESIEEVQEEVEDEVVSETENQEKSAAEEEVAVSEEKSNYESKNISRYTKAGVVVVVALVLVVAVVFLLKKRK